MLIMIQSSCFVLLELILRHVNILADVLSHHIDGDIMQRDRKLRPGLGHVVEVGFLALRFDVQTPSRLSIKS